MRANANDIVMGEVSFQGIPALYSELRLDRSTIPKNLCVYEMRYADGDCFTPVQITGNVSMNFYGTLLTAKPLEMPNEGVYLEKHPFDFKSCRKLTLEEFLMVNHIKAKPQKVLSGEAR